MTPRALTDTERAELAAAGWEPVSDPFDGARDEWRDPSSGSTYPAWRALEFCRRDAARDGGAR